MVSRSGPMGVYDTEQTTERWHLLRKIVLLLLLVVAAALGLVILFRQGPNFPLVLFNLLADVGLGILMGVGSRVVLRRRHWFIQAIASAALSIVGLAILGALTNARSGIGPVDLRLVREHWLDAAHIALWLPLQLGRSTMDLLDLAHVVIAVNASWLALRAWRGRSRSAVAGARATSAPPRPRTTPPASYPVMPRPSTSSAPAPARRAVAPRAATASPAVAQTPTRSRPMIRQRRLGRPKVSTGAAVLRPGKSGSGRRNPFRRRPAVHFAAYEDHRCPYCLEDVKRNDPRGTVECPVCHTLHHKDCWDITGTCQVPHLNG